MKNVNRQKSLENKYGRKGDYYYCEHCEKCIDKSIISNCRELLTASNCSHDFLSGTPCATAYNRVTRITYIRTPICKLAEKSSAGCMGYGHHEDEPIDKCKKCKDYQSYGIE